MAESHLESETLVVGVFDKLPLDVVLAVSHPVPLRDCVVVPQKEALVVKKGEMEAHKVKEELLHGEMLRVMEVDGVREGVEVEVPERQGVGEEDAKGVLLTEKESVEVPEREGELEGVMEPENVGVRVARGETERLPLELMLTVAQGVEVRQSVELGL